MENALLSQSGIEGLNSVTYAKQGSLTVVLHITYLPSLKCSILFLAVFLSMKEDKANM